jgi:hypothetical protein
MLVAVDDSPAGLAAARLAVDLCTDWKADLTLATGAGEAPTSRFRNLLPPVEPARNCVAGAVVSQGRRRGGRIVGGTGQRRDAVPTTTVSLVKIGALAGTRAALGAGIGLLVADRLEPGTRRAVGTALLAVGVASTIPLVVSIVRGVSPAA